MGEGEGEVGEAGVARQNGEKLGLQRGVDVEQGERARAEAGQGQGGKLCGGAERVDGEMGQTGEQRM